MKSLGTNMHSCWLLELLGNEGGLLIGEMLFWAPNKSCTLNMYLGERMLIPEFCVLLKWLEKPPYFSCSNKTSPNNSYWCWVRLSFGQAYKFIPTHQLRCGRHESQSTQGTFPLSLLEAFFFILFQFSCLTPSSAMSWASSLESERYVIRNYFFNFLFPLTAASRRLYNSTDFNWNYIRD